MDVFQGQNLLEFSDRFKTDLDCKEYLAFIKAKTAYKCSRCNHTACQKLKDYNDDDFILAMGDPVAIGISCIIASEVNNGKVNILKWDRENSCYYNVKINMYQKGESDV